MENSILHIIVEFSISPGPRPLWCTGARLPSRAQHCSHIPSWLGGFYHAVAPVPFTVSGQQPRSSLCFRFRPGSPRFSRYKRDICPVQVFRAKATLEHYSIPASLRRLQDGSCHPPPERFTAGGVNHERNKRNFISSKKKNCATTIATSTGGTENNNHHKKTWREADKQHLIFLHSHCELCQDNKDQPEPFGRFYG